MWTPYKDPRSRLFDVRSVIGPTPRYRRLWKPSFDPLTRVDNSIGAAVAGFLGCAPHKWPIYNEMADSIYFSSDRKNTLIGGMKAGQSIGYFYSYLWCFGVDDIIDTIVRKSPVVLGLPWYSGMSNPSAGGLLSVTGSDPTGRCILANGYWPQHPDFGDVIVLTNSEGRYWGINGRAYLRVSDLKSLLLDGGEAVVPHEVIQKPSVSPEKESQNYGSG